VKMIVETDGEEDFLEFVLRKDEVRDLYYGDGVQMEYPQIMKGDAIKNLNIYIRPEYFTEDE
jgi:hypothetical protein